MKTIADTIFDMRDENAAAANLEAALSEAGVRREILFWQMDEVRKGYGRALQRLVHKRAARIVRKHSVAWGVKVDVLPSYNHTTHQTLPMVTIRWAAKGIDLKMTLVVSAPNVLEQFLERFEAVVRSSQLRGEQLHGAIGETGKAVAK